jgi:endonuclease YncB( thermonuclease family)
MKWLLAFILALALVTPAQCAEDFLGTVVAVADGDTFRLKTDDRVVKVRLCGVDSPERSEPGYGAAAGALASLIEGKQVHCLQVGMGTPCDGRSKPMSRDWVVAQCFVGDRDVAMEMVRMKQACYWPKFSADHYRVDSSSCARR